MKERFESQFERVIDGTNGEKEAGLKKYTERLNESDDDIAREFKEFEVVKSPEDIALIQETEKEVDMMVVGWGGDPKPIPIEKVHIVREEAVLKITQGKYREGYHQSSGQFIVAEKGFGEIKFIQTLAHELFHQKSYHDVQTYDRRRSIGDYLYKRRGTKPYRMGLQMVDRKDPKAQPGEEDVYFSELEEAIVAFSTDRFVSEHLSNDPRYASAFNNAEKVKDWLFRIPEMFSDEALDPEIKKKFHALAQYIFGVEGDPGQELVEVLESQKDNNYKLGFLKGRLKLLSEKRLLIHADRVEEVSALEELCEQIAVQSNGQFIGKEEVVELFLRANYNGNILTLGKTIEKMLGKGSFRQIAERFKKTGKKRGLRTQLKELFW